MYEGRLTTRNFSVERLSWPPWVRGKRTDYVWLITTSYSSILQVLPVTGNERKADSFSSGMGR